MLNCFAYLGFTSLEDIEDIGLVEYQVRLEAYQLKRVQEQEDIAFQAWLNQAVQATTGGKKPKPKFNKFKDFFDSGYMIDNIRGQYEPDYQSESGRQLTAAEVMAKRIEEFRKVKERRAKQDG